MIQYELDVNQMKNAISRVNKAVDEAIELDEKDLVKWQDRSEMIHLRCLVLDLYAVWSGLQDELDADKRVILSNRISNIAESLARDSEYVLDEIVKKSIQ